MLANADAADARHLRRPVLDSKGPFACVLGALVLLAACEAPPDNLARQWTGDLRGPSTSGAAPGAPSEGPSAPGAGGRLGSGAGGASGGMMPGSGEEEPEDEEPTPRPGMGDAGGSSDAGRPSDMGAAPMPMGDGGATPGTAAACQVMVTVTTVTTNRDYAPRNVGALWIADANGRFVKSVAVWAATRANYLRNWVMSTTAAGVARNRTDAVTGATARNHMMPHAGTWNCTDSKGALQPQGKYQLCMEMTEANATGAYRCVPFDHAGTAYESMLPAHARFVDGRITYAAR